MSHPKVFMGYNPNMLSLDYIAQAHWSLIPFTLFFKLYWISLNDATLNDNVNQNLYLLVFVLSFSNYSLIRNKDYIRDNVSVIII